MKKKILILGLLIFLVSIISGCTLFKKNETNEGRLIEIGYTELAEKIENKDSFILVVTQTDCSHCAEYKPLLKEILKEYKIDAYELDDAKLTDEEYIEFKKIAIVSATPTTIFIVDGEEKQLTSRLVGSSTRSKIISRFKTMGYIK